MTRENKLALVVGFGLILLVGVLISDHFSTAQSQESADLVAGRPTDPLSRQRRSDPELIDLHARNDAQRSGGEATRTPLAMNTAEIDTEQRSATTTEQPDETVQDVQRVVMGEPVRRDGSRERETSGRDVPFIFHDVRPGETMTSIARKYYGDATVVDQLAAFNGLDNPDKLRVHHRLRIPASGDLGLRRTNAAPPETPSSREPEAKVTTYTVKPGDTLSELSLKLLGTSRRWRELYEYNSNVIDDPDNLLAGTELKIPSGRQ